MSSTLETTAEAQAALTAGAGSVGDCNGNPARCAAVNLSAGSYHSVALKSDGTVWTWGYNSGGQIGDGTTNNRSTPVQVSGLDGVTAVAGGAYYTVALKSGGTVWAWGRNVYGQLGDNSVTDQHTPVKVSGLTGVTTGDAGDFHTVALKSDGTVWAWGDNLYGQLGDNTTIDKLTPVQVNGLNGIAAVAAGHFHTVALKADGTVWTWGNNSNGQLGNGTIINNLTPVQVSGLTYVTAVDAGDFHTVALKSDGTVWAWGDNLYGQLGDSTTNDKHTPVKVSGLSLFPECGSTAGCNAATGACVALPVANGTLCNDGNACSQMDTCQAGLCTGTNHVACPAPDQCHTEGTCDPATGTCSNPAKPDSSPCDDSDACSQTDTCQASVCTGSSPVACPAADQCHTEGACNPVNGVCSFPASADDSPCDDGNACTQADTCQAGTCTAGIAVACSASDECHDVGTCDTTTGACSNPQKADDAPCSLGTCVEGSCTPSAETGTDTGTGGSPPDSTTDSTIGDPSETTIDLGCHIALPRRTSSSPAAWLGTAAYLALLALYRRRAALPRPSPQSH